MKIGFREAVRILKNGGIIIFPTDTAFGIGCRIDNKASVRRLYGIRKRPKDKAVPVLFESIKQVKKYVLPFDINVESLIKKHWPGALTLVLKCKVSKVSSLVRGGRESLGVRIPDHKLLRKLIREAGVPIVGTSANFAGKRTPFTFNELDKNLIKQIDGVMIDSLNQVLQGVSPQTRKSSTVVDCTNTPWKILRLGAIDLKI